MHPAVAGVANSTKWEFVVGEEKQTIICDERTRRSLILDSLHISIPTWIFPK